MIRGLPGSPLGSLGYIDLVTILNPVPDERPVG